MKPEYKPGYERNHDLLENEKLLPLHYSFLVQKMIHESQVLENQIRRFMIDTEPKSFYIKGVKQKSIVVNNDTLNTAFSLICLVGVEFIISSILRTGPNTKLPISRKTSRANWLF